MLTIISGTNRKNSYTRRVALHYLKRFNALEVETNFFSLEDLPPDFIFPDMYDVRSESFQHIQDEILTPATKFFFIFPEYNGSFPGVLKAFIDASDIPPAWYGKKAALAGISSGRAGNLRGMEHLTGILNYLKVTVMPNKLPISVIERLMDDNGNITDRATLKVIDKQIHEFVNF